VTDILPIHNPALICQMKTAHIQVLVGFFLTVALIVTFRVVTTPRPVPALTNAEMSLQIKRVALKERNLERDDAIRIAAVSGVLASLCASALIVAAGLHRERVRRASVFVAKIGQYSEIPVHIKQIRSGELNPQLATLAAAEQLERIHAGQEKIVAALESVIDTGTAQMRVIASQARAALPPATESEPGLHVPSAFAAPPPFAQLIETRELAHGKPMILAYVQGQPKRGSFLDIYSSAVAGESGSGKTATLLYLIACGLISEYIRFIAIDPHFPHPKSLGAKTRPLWENGFMALASSDEEITQALQEVETTIFERIRQIDTTTHPVVLVIDEVAFLSKSQTVGRAVTHTMERVSTEGRKCDVYMLASSQTWLAARTGGNSAVRDTLTSAYVHRIKPKQANLLLQDKAEAEMVRQYVKRAGDVLLCSVHDDPVVAQMPYTTEEDIKLVANMVNYPVNLPVTPPVNRPGNTPGTKTPIDHDLPDEPGELTDLLLIEYVRNHYETDKIFCEKAGINAGLFSRYTQKGKLTGSMRKAITKDMARPSLSVIRGGKA
jgi:hypothetical protein